MTAARAVSVTDPGGPEVLRVLERDVRDAGPGEIRIAVHAAAVNPTDIGLRGAGVAGQEAPWVPGMDAAGVVESVGEGVTRLAPGDEVMAAVLPRRPEGGAQASLVVVPEASAVPIPDGATPVAAATLPMNGLTAQLGLDLLGLEPGATLAVSGGAGLLASYVTVLAKERGLRVIADAKPEDEALVRGFGADEVVPRSDGGFAGAVRAVAPDGADALYDTALLGALGACATAAAWSWSAAGTARTPPSAVSRSTRSGWRRSWSGQTGSRSCARSRRAAASRSGWPASTRRSRPPRRTARWTRAASGAAP